MNWANGWGWLAALKQRRAAPRFGEPDAADMGTAFGLDASFGPVDAPPIPAGQPPLRPPWEHRLTRRSSL